MQNDSFRPKKQNLAPIFGARFFKTIELTNLNVRL